MATLTPNYGLKKPNDAEFGWTQMQRDNVDALDAAMKATSDEAALATSEAALAASSASFDLGTATAGSTIALTDTGKSWGVNTLLGMRIIIQRAGVTIRTENIPSNTANAISFAAGAAVLPGDTYRIYAGVNRELANGVAGLDTNFELIRLPSGAAAEVLAGRGSGYKRADGTWGYGGHKGVAYYNGASFTLPNSLWTKVPVNAVGMLVQNPQIPIVNGSLVIQKSGHYVLQAKIRIDYTSLGTFYVGIGKDGLITYATNFRIDPEHGRYAVTSTPAFLAAGTTIELFAWSNVGSIIIASGDNYIAAFEV